MKLKINFWNAILAIFNCFLFSASWFVIFATSFDDAFNDNNNTGSVATFFYAMAWIGVVLSIVAIWKSKKAKISIVGPVLCLVGNFAFGLSAVFALPSIVVLVIGAVFSFKQKPVQTETSQTIK